MQRPSRRSTITFRCRGVSTCCHVRRITGAFFEKPFKTISEIAFRLVTIGMADESDFYEGRYRLKSRIGYFTSNNFTFHFARSPAPKLFGISRDQLHL